MRDIYISMSGAIAQERYLDVIANNLANASTAGYKKDKISFQMLYPDIRPSVIGRSVAPEAKLAPPSAEPFGDKRFAAVQSVFTDYAQGDIRETHNPLDIAIVGDGFYVIETPEGERYSRAGNFMFNTQGELITPDGFRVMGEAGAITLESSDFIVGTDGSIMVGGELRERLRVVDFENRNALEKIGRNLFRIAEGADARPREIEPGGATTLRQHFLEYSNVNMVGELVDMIKLERLYQMSQSALKSIDDASKTTISGAMMS